jgi:hypothetical protein
MPGRGIRHGFLAFALCIAAALLLEGTAAAAHGDHGDDNCPMCLVVQHIKNCSRQLNCARLAFPAGTPLLSVFIPKQLLSSIPASSVKLKNKMNT